MAAAVALQQRPAVEEEQEQLEKKEEEEEKEPAPPIRQFLTAGVAINYLQLVAKRYVIVKSTHKYMHDAVAIAELVRLQRWVRHQRLKKVFFKLLRHRRIVIKALIRYALRFQVRYKHRCANIVLKFFNTCFEEVRAASRRRQEYLPCSCAVLCRPHVLRQPVSLLASCVCIVHVLTPNILPPSSQAGFRMAMKIFIFRVVRTQRVMKTFLACTRARQEAVRQQLEAHPELWEGDPKRERTARYICAVCPSLLLPIIRRYRRPYMAARTVYRRCLKAGDLTPAFQSLTTNTIRSFLANPSTAVDTEPPQYAGGKLRPPVFLMHSNEALLEDLAALLDKHEKRAAFHERKMAKEAEDRRRQAEMDDAVRRGKTHEYALAQMQLRVKEEEPIDRFTKALEELTEFERWKTCQMKKIMAAAAAEAREGKRQEMALDKLREEQPRKIL